MMGTGSINVGGRRTCIITDGYLQKRGVRRKMVLWAYRQRPEDAGFHRRENRDTGHMLEWL
jgi:hypothetical protein